MSEIAQEASSPYIPVCTYARRGGGHVCVAFPKLLGHCQPLILIASPVIRLYAPHASRLTPRPIQDISRKVPANSSVLAKQIMLASMLQLRYARIQAYDNKER